MTQGTQQQARPVLVGTSLPRQDGPDKVTGRARYAGDQAVPGMLYACLVLSPYGHARILNIDTSAALSVPGVVAIFNAETLGMAQADSLSRAQSPLAQQEALWCGHPVAIVVGETEASAEDGLREAEVVVECSYRTHPVHQSYLEPQSVTVAPSASGHHLVLWSSTQGLFNVRSAVAQALDMPERQIRVEPVHIGGGFGG